MHSSTHPWTCPYVHVYVLKYVWYLACIHLLTCEIFSFHHAVTCSSSRTSTCKFNARVNDRVVCDCHLLQHSPWRDHRTACQACTIRCIPVRPSSVAINSHNMYVSMYVMYVCNSACTQLGTACTHSLHSACTVRDLSMPASRRSTIDLTSTGSLTAAETRMYCTRVSTPYSTVRIKSVRV